jgi:hypothetical protein
MSTALSILTMGTYVCDLRGHPYVVLQRSLKNGNLWVAEAVAG